MNDVTGVLINIGDNVLYVHHDSGIFRPAVVIGFTKHSVKLSRTDCNFLTKKLPKFIVVNNGNRN